MWVLKGINVGIWLLNPSLKGGALRNGDVLLCVCLFVCLFVCLLIVLMVAGTHLVCHWGRTHLFTYLLCSQFLLRWFRRLKDVINQ